jgi:hypothetical protein
MWHCSATSLGAGGWTAAGQKLHGGTAQNGTVGPPSKPDSQHGNPLFGQVCHIGCNRHISQLNEAMHHI